MKKTKDPRTWYRFVLGDIEMPSPCFVDLAEYLCDSRLEVSFLLEFLALTHSVERLTRDYALFERNYRGPLLGVSDVAALPIPIEEPFQSAHELSACSVQGASKGFILNQVFDGKRKWDFGIWHGFDNGAEFKDCELCLLVDIDGFGVHSQQRGIDNRKLEGCTYPACRVKEESFLTVKEMAEAVLAASLWYPDVPCLDGTLDDENLRLIELRSRLVVNDHKKI